MAIELKREAGAAMAQALTIRQHALLADVSVEEGGADAGPSPHDFYDAALASCKALTVMYLSAAFKVFYNDTFHYVRELVSTNDAILEFEVEIDGIKVNGVDMMKWNDDGLIVDFKVMLRPLKAVNLIHQKMGAMLEAYAKR